MTGTDRQAWMIGHWTSPESEFLAPLLAERIELLIDVRALPGSRRSPQFNADQMPSWLGREGIDYQHLTQLAGRRPRQDVDPDVNAAWQNRSFKNYADYTLSEGFRDGLDLLQDLASERRTVVMCGEPMPWRCHRLLIANTLVARGWTVWHLFAGRSPRRHELGLWGAQPQVADDLTVTYPAD